MPSKGKDLHKKLKEKALQKVVSVFDIDKIDRIYIEPSKEKYGDSFFVETNLFGLRASRRFFPDIVFKYPLDEPVRISNAKARDLRYDILDDGMITHKVVVIECEVRQNSQLLSGGLRKIGYQMLKEQYGDLLYLILAKYKESSITDTDIFDEVWEFEK